MSKYGNCSLCGVEFYSSQERNGFFGACMNDWLAIISIARFGSRFLRMLSDRLDQCGDSDESIGEFLEQMRKNQTIPPKKRKFTKRQISNANPSFGTLDKSMALAEVPKNIAVINTANKSFEQIVAEMMRVPMDKHMLLDFCVGRRRGDEFESKDHADLYRLQMMLNSEVRGERFDWLGDGMIEQMVRKSVVEELWKSR